MKFVQKPLCSYIYWTKNKHTKFSKSNFRFVQCMFQPKTLFKSNLVSRKSKLKLYWSVIRPIAVYGCETWVLKESIIQKLSVFERKILGKIFGPTKEANGIWRVKTNKELDELIIHRNIINYGLGMWCVWVRRGECIGSWWGNWREGDYWGDLGLDGWIILGWTSRRWDVGIWTGLGWPRIGTGGGRL